MRYRILAVDLDNTLLNEDGAVSDRNLRALHRAEEAGCRVVICTARGRCSTLPAWEAMQPVSGPHIVFNGAAIYACLDSEPIDLLVMDQEVVLRRFADAGCEGIGVSSFEDPRHGDSVHCAQPTPALRGWMEQIDGRGVLRSSVDEALDRSSVAVLCWGTQEQLESLAERLGDHDEFTSPRVAPALQHDSWLLELTAHGATKGGALSRLAVRLGVARDSVIGMGDAPADISMLEYAGLGVAVGNAKDDVKAVADYISASADEDGVAEVVERFVLSGD